MRQHPMTQHVQDDACWVTIGTSNSSGSCQMMTTELTQDKVRYQKRTCSAAWLQTPPSPPLPQGQSLSYTISLSSHQMIRDYCSSRVVRTFAAFGDSLAWWYGKSWIETIHWTGVSRSECLPCHDCACPTWGDGVWMFYIFNSFGILVLESTSIVAFGLSFDG